MNIKGLTSTPKRLERAANRTAPRDHLEVVSEVASLYRQEARLEKNVLLWKRNQKQAECELRRVQKRRAFLGRVHDDRRKAATRPEIPTPSPQPQSEPEPEPRERQPPITLERQRIGHRAARR